MCVLAEAALCSPNFKLITTLLARSDTFSNFYTVFHLSCFLPSLLLFFSPFPSPNPSVFPRCFSRSVSPLLCCANIIKLSRLYYTATLHFYFLAPSPLSSIYMLSNILPFPSYSAVLSLIFMPHRAETLQNCVILLPTVTSIFHRASRVLLTFPLFSIAPFPLHAFLTPTTLLSCYCNI